MKCPHCGVEIPDSEIAKHMGSKGGKKATHTLSDEHQAKMQAGREKKRREREEGKI